MGAERRRLFRNNACCLFVKIKKKRGKKEEANYFAFVRFFALPPDQKKIRDNIISSDPSARVLSLRSRSFLSIQHPVPLQPQAHDEEQTMSQ